MWNAIILACIVGGALTAFALARLITILIVVGLVKLMGYGDSE